MTFAPRPTVGGEQGTITLTLPLPPNMANGRMHWRVKDRKRKAYLAACDTYQAAGIAPAPPPSPISYARITVIITHTRWSDDDNAMARLKWAVDWLVTRGYLADDSRKHLTWTGLPHQHITRSFEPGIQITLTPVSQPAPRPAAHRG